MNRQQLIESVKQFTKSNHEKVVSWRRHIHQNPELSFSEFETTLYIEQQLQAIGVTNIKRITETGLVALIDGPHSSGEAIALRADIDALPIFEANDISYCSKNNGVMHACGHDCHAASLLGAANVIWNHRNLLKRPVKLIFQPGEEKMPGGASKMIEKGVLTNPKVSDIVGQHVFPALKTGQIGLRSGMYMASCDEIYITVTGKGGHGALPNAVIDPILISSHIVIALQQLVSRRAVPGNPTVLSIGKIEGLGATNVIPNEVKMEGTFRAMNETWRKQAHQELTQMVIQMAQSMGASAEVNIVKGYPFLQNHPELTLFIHQLASEYVGPENVIDLDIWMGAEDFSYYSQEVPACFYRFGTNNPTNEYSSPVHTTTFNIDESALLTSVGFMAYTALARD